ncbi:MAG TPA: hypothetical protein VI094_02065 [Propionibacteriaceae bacterium]
MSLIGNGAAMLLGLPEVRRDLEDFIPPGRPFRLVTSQPYAVTAAVLSFVARSSHPDCRRSGVDSAVLQLRRRRR